MVQSEQHVICRLVACTWRSDVRSATHAASQLPGKGPTDVDDVPAPAC